MPPEEPPPAPPPDEKTAPATPPDVAPEELAPEALPPPRETPPEVPAGEAPPKEGTDGDPADLKNYTANSDAPDADDEDALSGYVQPQFSVLYRNTALPQDRTALTLGGSRLGLIFAGKHFKKFSYTAHFVLDPTGQQVLAGTLAAAGSQTNQLIGPKVLTSATALFFGELTMTYQPATFLAIKGGFMYIPFTGAQRVSNTALMFPNRAPPNDVFIAGADGGLLAMASTNDARLQASAGIFDGSSVGLTVQEHALKSVGVVYAGRVDFDPFGKFPWFEGDMEHSKFRAGIGFGTIYRPVTVYDPTGYEGRSVRDLRVTASLRMAVSGFYFQAEYLHRQQVDNLTARPLVATGAYAQTSYYKPVSTVALSPLARVGFTINDQDFSPTTDGYLEAGVAFFPVANVDDPTRLRILLQYQGEHRFAERDNAHGAVLQGQLKF